MIFHTRRFQHDWSLNWETLHVQKRTFFNICRNDIGINLADVLSGENYKIKYIEYTDASKENQYLNDNLSLREHESPKMIINFYLKGNHRELKKTYVAKYIGYSRIGEKRNVLLNMLSEFTPSITIFRKGVVVYEYILCENSNLNYFHLKLVVKYFYSLYVLSKSRKICYYEYIENVKKECLLGLDNALESKINTILCYFQVSFGFEKCNMTEPDWRLEKSKWLFEDKKIVKFDNFHFMDYDDSPEADVFLQLAGFLIEFDLCEKTETAAFNN